MQYIQYHKTVIGSLLTAGALSLLLVCTNGYGQQIESAVINNFGTTLTVNQLTFDAAVGELATTTIQADGYAITQGFLQPVDLKTPCGDVVLKAFPNPVTVGMKIYAEGCDLEVVSVMAYDLFGKLVYEGRLTDNQVNLSSIGVGVYLIRAYNQDNQIVGAVKIIKSTI